MHSGLGSFSAVGAERQRSGAKVGTYRRLQEEVLQRLAAFHDRMLVYAIADGGACSC